MTHIVQQFIRFTGVGAIGTGFHYGVLVGGVQGFGLDPVVATSLGFGLGAVVNYYLNYHYTFQSRQRHRDAAPKFFSVAAAGLLLNALIMWLLVGVVHYLAAQILATGLVLLWNFLVNRVWTFQAGGG